MKYIKILILICVLSCSDDGDLNLDRNALADSIFSSIVGQWTNTKLIIDGVEQDLMGCQFSKLSFRADSTFWENYYSYRTACTNSGGSRAPWYVEEDGTIQLFINNFITTTKTELQDSLLILNRTPTINSDKQYVMTFVRE